MESSTHALIAAMLVASMHVSFGWQAHCIYYMFLQWKMGAPASGNREHEQDGFQTLTLLMETNAMIFAELFEYSFHHCIISWPRG
jgi:hypothetical protein